MCAAIFISSHFSTFGPSNIDIKVPLQRTRTLHHNEVCWFRFRASHNWLKQRNLNFCVTVSSVILPPHVVSSSLLIQRYDFHQESLWTRGACAILNPISEESEVANDDIGCYQSELEDINDIQWRKTPLELEAKQSTHDKVTQRRGSGRQMIAMVKLRFFC